MRAVTRRWEMQDGRKVRICDMSDSHLENTVRMLERNAELRRQYFRSLPFRNDPLGAMFFDIAAKHGLDLFDDFDDSDPLEHDDLYIALCAEQARREAKGITVPVNWSLAVAAFKDEPL